MSMTNDEKIELADSKYREAVKLLAQAYKLSWEVDQINYPAIAKMDRFEYVQDTIDFDELCQDISDEMAEL